MGKLKLFIENFLVYGLGGIISKIIPLIMVPIVTRLMPNAEYFGLYDLSHTVESIAIAIAIMGMYDAMYRLFFEKDDEDYKKKVCSTAFVFTLVTSFIVFIVMLVCKNLIAQHLFGESKYFYVVYLTALATLVGATNGIISAPTRMQNKKIIFMIANTIGPVISYAISIPMLFAGYYVIALPLAAVISGITKEAAFFILNRKWFDPSLFDIAILKQMLVIAIPLLPNFLIYWLFNSCDKIMITKMIGLGAAGIYSVGSKLGSASQLIYTAFAGGWQFFAFSTMKEENQVKSNSLVFEYLGIISFITTAFVCTLSYSLFDILFETEYLGGCIVAPYLYLAPLLQMLFQVAANQFLVVKVTWPNLFILSFGAVLNIILNYYLIPVLGIEGAAIATLAGYIVSDIICAIALCRMKLMIISPRFVCAAITMAGYILTWRVFFVYKLFIGCAAALVFTGIMLYLYRAELKALYSSVKHI